MAQQGLCVTRERPETASGEGLRFIREPGATDGGWNLYT